MLTHATSAARDKPARHIAADVSTFLILVGKINGADRAGFHAGLARATLLEHGDDALDVGGGGFRQAKGSAFASPAPSFDELVDGALSLRHQFAGGREFRIDEWLGHPFSRRIDHLQG